MARGRSKAQALARQPPRRQFFLLVDYEMTLQGQKKGYANRQRKTLKYLFSNYG
jgi:hypothetical protein